MNFLERLVAEWYDYNGYFVKKNIKIPKKQGLNNSSGGFEREIDIAALNPKKKELIHIECAADSKSWIKRSKAVNKQLLLEDYKRIFPLAEIKTVARIAIAGRGNTTKQQGWPQHVALKSITEFMIEMKDALKNMRPEKKAVSECYPLIRAIQYAINYGISNNDKSLQQKRANKNKKFASK